jgi:hypothetical protein
MGGSFSLWLFAVSMAASALGGMLGMAGGIFIVPLLTIFGHLNVPPLRASATWHVPKFARYDSVGGAAGAAGNRLGFVPPKEACRVLPDFLPEEPDQSSPARGTDVACAQSQP